MLYLILDRYIGKIIFYNISVVFFVLLSLSSLIKFIDELRKVGQGCYGVLEIGVYVFLSILKDVEFFFPIAILIGVFLGLSLLLIRNELILIEVFGFSFLRIIGTLLKTVLPLILFGMFISEWVVPISERVARNYRYKMINNVSVRSYNDLWIKDGNDFIYVEKMIRYDELLGVHIYHFSDDKRLEVIRYVMFAKFIDNAWSLFNVDKLSFDNYMCVFEKRNFNDMWITVITPDYLSMFVMSLYYSDSLSVFDLYRYIFVFKKNAQKMVEYQLRFWKKIFFPVSVLVMMLTALSCILRSLLCKLNFGYQVVVGVMYGFFFMF